MAAADRPGPGTPPVRRPFSIGGPVRRGEWLALALIALGYLLIVWLSVRRGPPLGWDESVYSLRARDFADGVAPGRYWNDYRAPGLPWLGHLLWVAGREATLLRLLVAAFGLGMAGVTWLITRHLFGPRAGLIAGAGVAVTPPLVLAATQVWPDVPGAAVGLLAVGLFILSTGGERPSWWMLTVAPAAAAATFLRFGAPLPMAVGLLAVGVWRRRVLVRRPAAVVATALAAMAAVVAVVAVPALTGGKGSPLAAIRAAAGGGLEGFVDFARLGHEVVGPAAVVLALAGAAAAWGFAGREGVDRGALATAGAIGLATAAAIAFVLHGEVRYLAPAYPWLWIAAAPGLEQVGRALPGRARPAAASLVAVVLAVATVGIAQERNHDAGQGYKALMRASEAIAAEVGGQPCLVVTRRLPQVMWYSGCDAMLFDMDEVRLPVRPGERTFMLLFEGDRYEPTGALRDAYLAAAGEPRFRVEGYRDVVVYEIAPPGVGG